MKAMGAAVGLSVAAILWLVWLGGGMVTHPDVQEIVILIVLVALAPLLKVRRAAILIIYVFVMIATGMARHVDLFLTDTPAVSYFATPENRFERWQQYLPSWFFPSSEETVRRMYEGAEDEAVPWREWIRPVYGWLALLLLFILRSLFLRFPLHPLGFAMTAYYGIVLWGPFLTVWMAKAVLYKVGGQRLYLAFIPFFLGLLLGEVVALGIVYPLVYVLGYPDLSVAPIFA